VIRSSAKEPKQRLDEALVERGLADTRSRAKALIMAGDVLVSGNPVMQAGAPVRGDDHIELKAKPRFASRGGEKLDHALNEFGVEVVNMVCADFGASTGGFADCLLQRGAARVYAIDVGYGQLDGRLRSDPRIVNMERTNARYLDELAEPVEMVVIDASFISLGLLFPAAVRVMTGNGICIPLIKPQFEAGRSDVGKGGVVKSASIHRRVLAEVIEKASDNGLGLRGLTKSPLKGPAGNTEFLAHFVRGEDGLNTTKAIMSVVDTGGAN
jgi:23S rRNA (cytidine1920-2'-O)/16S rRNA (cytidine1409-2'-O)-methyltransferase